MTQLHTKQPWTTACFLWEIERSRELDMSKKAIINSTESVVPKYPIRCNKNASKCVVLSTFPKQPTPIFSCSIGLEGGGPTKFDFRNHDAWTPQRNRHPFTRREEGALKIRVRPGAHYPRNRQGIEDCPQLSKESLRN